MLRIKKNIKFVIFLISGTHRHLVFTISDVLWLLFLEDRKRLNFMFEAVSTTLLSWYKEKYKDKNLTPGFILTLHTFGRDDKWNVHIHCLLSEFALGNTGEMKMDFIPFDMLLKRFQKILLDLLENDIGKSKFRPIKNLIYFKYNNGFYASRKHKLYDACKKLIDKTKLPFYHSLTKWRNLLITSFNIEPLKCPSCGTIMDFVYAFT